MSKVIAIGNDHGGLDYKNAIVKYLVENGYNVINVGTDTNESCDYPIFGREVGRLVSSGEADFGVVICTTGEGIAIAANKVKGVRCGIAYNPQVAELMRKHNNANVISFGQKYMDLDMCLESLKKFLETPFEGGRHERRVNLISDSEKER